MWNKLIFTVCGDLGIFQIKEVECKTLDCDV